MSKGLKEDVSVLLIFIGGFLGAGKTTAIAKLVKHFLDKGIRVGVITNDQTENLVDTAVVKSMLQELGVPIEEVVRGCFCCRFDDLLRSVDRILEFGPEVIIGELVGSCTDFVATVANPIRLNYPRFKIAPFSVMLDPVRVRELIMKEIPSLFGPEVFYLYQKQIEEADILVLNKCDLLDVKEEKRLKNYIESNFPGKLVFGVSVKEGIGLNEWFEVLLSYSEGSRKVIQNLDYDTYARAEALLGWLNANLIVSSKNNFHPVQLIKFLISEIKEKLKRSGAEIAHIKILFKANVGTTWINCTHLEGNPLLGDEWKWGLVTEGELILNARVGASPALLESIVNESLVNLQRIYGIEIQIKDFSCFSPSYPNPPYVIRQPLDNRA